MPFTRPDMYEPEPKAGTVVFCHRCHARYTAEGGIPYVWNGLMQKYVASCSMPKCGGTLLAGTPGHVTVRCVTCGQLNEIPRSRSGQQLCGSCMNDLKEAKTMNTCEHGNDDDRCSKCSVERRAPDSPMRSKEAVDHPSHYGGKDDVYETIKVLRAWLDRLKFTPYQAGLYFNVVKYLSRAGLKGALLEDLKKAQFYLNELIRVVEETK